MKTNIILAIDPGYDRLGWAVGQAATAHDLKVLGFGCIQTNKKQDLFQRFANIMTELQQILTQYKPDHLAIESLYFSKNTTTALKVSQTRGIIIGSCIQSKMEIFEYNPSQIKLAVTGHGKASKTAMEKMVRLQLKLPSEKIIDDTIDALAILLTHTVAHRTQSARIKA